MQPDTYSITASVLYAAKENNTTNMFELSKD